MSKEDLVTLNTKTLIGNTDKRGFDTWHYRAELQGDEPNHYPGFIPIEDVNRRLFYWDALEAPVYVNVDGNMVHQADRKAIVRSDNGHVLGMFKNTYAIHQYREFLITNVQNLVDNNEIGVESAGELREGGIAWVCIARPDNVDTASGFPIRPYILATTSHNGTIATTYKQVCNVPVCDNTLFARLAEDGAQHKTRHSKNSVGRIQNIRDALDIMFTMTEDFVTEIDRLGSITVTDREWDAIVNRLMPIGVEGTVPQSAISKMENKQETIRQMYRTDPMVAPWAGSALGVLQAFNTFAHHVSGSNKARGERNSLNAITGKIRENDHKVLDVINELVLA